MAGIPPEKHRYTLLVDDNFHYMDKSEQYEHGQYDSCARAIEECRHIIDKFLATEHKAAMTPEQLWKLYSMFGDDPFIVTTDPDCSFSAWDYARRRCHELCAANSKS